MATLLTKEARLADTVLEGQVLVLDVDGVRVAAPSKAKPWFKLAIDAVIPLEGCPSKVNVNWIMGLPESKMRRLFVVAEFEDGTFNMSEVETMEG